MGAGPSVEFTMGDHEQGAGEAGRTGLHPAVGMAIAEEERARAGGQQGVGQFWVLVVLCAPQGRQQPGGLELPRDRTRGGSPRVPYSPGKPQ